MNLIFISNPYTHKDKKVELERYNAVLKYTAQLMNSREMVFSPIVHCHELAVQHELPGDWKFWQVYCEIMISKCQCMHVLMLDGWEDSVGTKAEISFAEKLGLEIKYIKQ
jgi:hypothetical protein